MAVAIVVERDVDAEREARRVRDVVAELRRPDSVENRRFRTIAALIIGAGIPLSGFAPLNNVADVLAVRDFVPLTLLTPPALLAVFALLAAWIAPMQGPRAAPPLLLRVGAGLLVLGGALSLLGSDDPGYSAVLLIMGLIAPCAVFVGARRADLPLGVMAGGFLGATTLLLLRADLNYFGDYGFGLPTGADLFQAKFSNAPYDFHYYGLGNPDQTATFVLLSLTLALFWKHGRRHPSAAAKWRIAVVALCAFTLVLLYARVPIAIGLAVGVAAILTASIPRAAKAAVLLGLVIGGVAFASDPVTQDYLGELTSQDSDSSGVERVTSIADGFQALGDHPLTGVGLGRYGTADGLPPAHSAVAQAAADMGLLGLAGIVLVLLAIAAIAVRRLRDGGSKGLPAAAALAVLVYSLAAVVVGGATAGVAVGLVPVWGLSVALLLAFADASGVRSPAWVPEPLRSRDEAATWLAARWQRVGTRPSAGKPGKLVLGSAPPLVAYGAALGSLVAFYLLQTLPAKLSLLGSRQTDLEAVFAAHKAGKGPLVGLLPADGGFYPVAFADDPGLFLILPLVGDLFGSSDPDAVFRGFYVGLVFAALLVLPFLAARLFRSTLAGVLVPLAAVVCFAFTQNKDIYWVLALALAVGLPALLVADRRWTRSRPVPPMLLLAVVVMASAATMTRSGAGLPLLAVAVVIVWTRTSRRHRLPALAIVAVAYISISSVAIGIALEKRTRVMGDTPIAESVSARIGAERFSQPIPSRHPTWHSIYIGLGSDRNPYGIDYRDENAVSYVRKRDPTAPYVSPRYESVLRDRVVDIARDDPGFIARTSGRKALLLLYDGISQFPLALLSILAAFVVWGRRSWERRSVGLVGLAAAVAAVPPLIVVPYEQYELGWFAAFAWLTLLGVGWGARALQPWADRLVADPAVRLVTDALSTAGFAAGEGVVAATTLVLRRPSSKADKVRDARGLRRVLARVDRRSRVAAIAIVFVAACTYLAVERAAEDAKNARQYATTISRPLSYGAPLQPAIRTWSLGGRGRELVDIRQLGTRGSTRSGGATIARTEELPRGWSSLTPALRPSLAGLGITTTEKGSGYQLEAPPVRLAPGSYLAAVRGRVEEGGLQLGVLDSDDQWLNTTQFRSERLPPRPVTMTTAFTVSDREKVTVVLANFSNESLPSRWMIESVLITPAAGEDTKRFATLSRRERTAESGSGGKGRDEATVGQ